MDIYIYIYPIIQYESSRLGNDDRVDRRGFIKQHWIYQMIIKWYFSKSCQNQRNDIMSIWLFISNDIIPQWFRPYLWVLSVSNLRVVTYGGTWWKRVLVVKYWPPTFLAPQLLLVVSRGFFQRMDLYSRGIASFVWQVESPKQMIFCSFLLLSSVWWSWVTSGWIFLIYAVERRSRCLIHAPLGSLCTSCTLYSGHVSWSWVFP